VNELRDYLLSFDPYPQELLAQPYSWPDTRNYFAALADHTVLIPTTASTGDPDDEIPPWKQPPAEGA